MQLSSDVSTWPSTVLSQLVLSSFHFCCEPLKVGPGQMRNAAGSRHGKRVFGIHN